LNEYSGSTAADVAVLFVPRVPAVNRILGPSQRLLLLSTIYTRTLSLSVLVTVAPSANRPVPYGVEVEAVFTARLMVSISSLADMTE
ncbi:hypothetical protein PC111_g14826, partial [Phytophthora cactorum]